MTCIEDVRVMKHKLAEKVSTELIFFAVEFEISVLCDLDAIETSCKRLGNMH